MLYSIIIRITLLFPSYLICFKLCSRISEIYRNSNSITWKLYEIKISRSNKKKLAVIGSLEANSFKAKRLIGLTRSLTSLSPYKYCRESSRISSFFFLLNTRLFFLTRIFWKRFKTNRWITNSFEIKFKKWRFVIFNNYEGFCLIVREFNWKIFNNFRIALLFLGEKRYTLKFHTTWSIISLIMTKLYIAYNEPCYFTHILNFM